MVLFDVLSYDRVQRIPKLVRDTGVDHCQEGIFCLRLIVHDSVGNINNLEHGLLLIVLLKVGAFNLNVSFRHFSRSIIDQEYLLRDFAFV